mgnify:CR=1 FL=1
MYWRIPNGFGPALQELERLRRNMDDLWDGFSGRAAAYPAVNVWTNQEKLMVTAELPGLKPEELEVSVNGNMLTIHATPRASEGEPAYQRRERALGEFHRTIELPCDVDAAKVDARLEKGILAVALPRAEADKPRRIAVKAS